MSLPARHIGFGKLYTIPGLSRRGDCTQQRRLRRTLCMKCHLVGNAQVSVHPFWDDRPIGFDELSRQPKAMAGPSPTYLLKMPLGTHELFRNDRHICP